MLENLHPKMLVTARSTKILATIFLVGFIVLHAVMAVVFYQNGIIWLSSFDMFSVGFYCIEIVLLYREYWRTFATAIFVQVYGGIVLAVVCVGWDAGFQLAIIAIIVLGFYAEYAARTMRVKTLHALNFAAYGLIIYIALLVYSYLNEPLYVLPNDILYGFRILWGAITIVVASGYLQLFITIALNSEQIMSDKATHDNLTGLPNRYYMSDYLNKIASDEGLGNYWVAMIDIDDFKHVNDTYGHNCGDFVLKTIADLMNDNAASYTLCRWGGEEFLLSGKVENDARVTIAMLERLRKSIEEHSIWYEDQRLSLTVTIGMACYEENQTIGEWVNAADKQLYEGKCSGKNQVRYSVRSTEPLHLQA